MINFQTLRQKLNESGSSVIKTFKINKSSEAVITKVGSKYHLHINGEKLDDYPSVKEAEKEFSAFIGVQKQ